MSNLIQHQLLIPTTVQLQVGSTYLIVKGKLGQVRLLLPKDIIIFIKQQHLYVSSVNNMSYTSFCSLLKHAFKAVIYGHQVTLKLFGLGYKAYIKQDTLHLKIGFSNIITYKIPLGIKVHCYKGGIVRISGVNLLLVKEITSHLLSFRKPDVYKGKGIRIYKKPIREKKPRKEAY